MRAGEKIIYAADDSRVVVTQDDKGEFFLHITGIGWASMTPDQGADLGAKLSTAAFPFQPGSRREAG